MSAPAPRPVEAEQRTIRIQPVVNVPLTLRNLITNVAAAE
jgi:hypothetical protein